jgi:hypothetical protein
MVGEGGRAWTGVHMGGFEGGFVLGVWVQCVYG